MSSVRCGPLRVGKALLGALVICATAMARHTASNRENKMQQVVGNMIERPRAHSPACRLLKRALQNSQMAVRRRLARAQRQWDCEAVSGSHELLSGRGKSQDRGAFNALHATNGRDAPDAAHAQQMSKQAAKRKTIRSGSLIDLLSVLGGSYCKLRIYMLGFPTTTRRNLQCAIY